MESYEDHPVIYVTWHGAYEYAKWVGGTLPTEAQWEYACRGGQNGSLPFGIGDDGTKLISGMANFHSNYSYDIAAPNGLVYDSNGDYVEKTTAVGSYDYENGYGLYDMHGNVWEWCYDFWDYSDYGSNPVTDPVSLNSDYAYDNRVLRGGGWESSAQDCRSAYRGYSPPQIDNDNYGFRVVFVQ